MNNGVNLSDVAKFRAVLVLEKTKSGILIRGGFIGGDYYVM